MHMDKQQKTPAPLSKKLNTSNLFFILYFSKEP